MASVTEKSEYILKNDNNSVYKEYDWNFIIVIIIFEEVENLNVYNCYLLLEL